VTTPSGAVRPEKPNALPETATSTARPGLPLRSQLILGLRSLYAEQLGYPEELVTEDIDLEADLGIDSIKQIEVFDAARRHFGLPQPPANLRVTAATTLGGIADSLERIADAGTPAGE
jgi:acyl carrier protein